MNNEFISDLDKLGLNLSDRQLGLFDQYFAFLVSENEKFNLTNITARDEVFKKHFIDSLSLFSYGLDLTQSYQVIDVGSGAGFPGIALKIAFPSLTITLLDSLYKRVSFLEELIALLNLSGIHAIHGRAEDLARSPSFRELYDFCVSRAVANLSTLSEYCLPFVKPGGLFIAYKSEDVADEINNAQNGISLLGGQVDKHISFTLPNSDITRSLVGIRKVSETPSKYPRRAGLPGKKPL